MSRTSRKIIQYYAALQLSAAAATVDFPDDVRERPPIIRASDHVLPNGFDRREVVQHGRSQYVITVSLPTPPKRTRDDPFSAN